jgi:hypothetical protein
VDNTVPAVGIVRGPGAGSRHARDVTLYLDISHPRATKEYELEFDRL